MPLRVAQAAMRGTNTTGCGPRAMQALCTEAKQLEAAIRCPRQSKHWVMHSHSHTGRHVSVAQLRCCCKQCAACSALCLMCMHAHSHPCTCSVASTECVTLWAVGCDGVVEVMSWHQRWLEGLVLLLLRQGGRHSCGCASCDMPAQDVSRCRPSAVLRIFVWWAGAADGCSCYCCCCHHG